MALFGIQFVISVAVATVLQKLSPYFSVARYIICNEYLYRYLHPTDEELKNMAAKGSVVSKGKGRKNLNDAVRRQQPSNSNSKTFTVPCNIDITLQRVKIKEADMLPQFLYADYKWLVDYSVAAMVVNLLIMSLAWLWPAVYTQEFNLSLVWNLLAVIFTIKVLFSLMAAYWRGDDTGERSMCIIFGLFFFVLSMAVLVIDESLLDFGLETGYDSFSEKAVSFLKKQEFSTREPAPKWVFKLCLAVTSSVIGAFLSFPGIRLANMYLDSLFYCKEAPFMIVLLHCSFMAPLFVSLMWISPIIQDPLISGSWHETEGSPILTKQGYHDVRAGLVIAVCVLRLSLTWRHLQSYLDMAQDRVEKMKRETGRITNVELQRKVGRVFFYLSAAVLQYLAPTLLLLFLVLMLRVINVTEQDAYEVQPPSSLQYKEFLSNSTREAALSLRAVFSPLLAKGLLSFLVWWVCTAWFITSVFGVVYLKIFDKM